MPVGYWPIFIFLGLAVLMPVGGLLVARQLRPSAPNPTKGEAYECGIPSEGNPRGRYTIRFYIIAILFVIFEVETLFLYPWAVRYQQLGWFGVAEALVFLAILAVGYVWAFQNKSLDW